MDAVIETSRCRWCLAPIVLSPFVAQWVTIPDSVCTDNPEVWMLHAPLVSYSPSRLLGVMGDLVDVLYA